MEVQRRLQLASTGDVNTHMLLNGGMSREPRFPPPCDNATSLAKPLRTVLPSDGAASDAAAASTLQLTEGQRERIERNLAMALQRRQAAASSPPTPDVQHISQSPTVTPASKEGGGSAGHKKCRLVLDDSDCGQKKARLVTDDGRMDIYECLGLPNSSAEAVADD